MWSSFFVWTSLFFVIGWFVNSGYLHWPTIYNYWTLGLSLILVLLGFINTAIVWWRLLAISRYPVSFRLALASTGLTIFGKYVPGKLWTVVGRAGYIVERSEYNLTELTTLSLIGQILSVWTGLLLGTSTILWTNIPTNMIWGISAGLVILSLILWTNVIYYGARFLITRLRIKIPIPPKLNFHKLIEILPFLLISWGSWAFGFSLFAHTITGIPINYGTGFAFILAATVGIIALLAPGGLGIREGVLSGILILFGLNGMDILTITIYSRIWFLIGEIGLFILGLWAHIKK